MEKKRIIELDVGGKIFRTTVSTLCSIEDSYFSSMLEGGRWQEGRDNGPIFIDRDPECFGGILSYLRSQTVIFDPEKDSTIYLRKLLLEADFYLLDDLTACILEELEARASKEQTQEIEPVREEMFKSIKPVELASYLDRGWKYHASFAGDECLGCVGSGERKVSTWESNVCTGCSHHMTYEKFSKHVDLFKPTFIIVTRKGNWHIPEKKQGHQHSSIQIATSLSLNNEPLAFDESFG